jgi:putative ABC transport system permease protein
VARRLFGNVPAVGQEVRINGATFDVIGVMPNKAQISNYFYPDKLSVFIPYTVTARKEYVDNILFQALNPGLHLQALKQVRELLAARHRFNSRDERAVNIRDTGDIEQMIGGITQGLQLVLYFIGTLTLMIGGVGVMNIMLVSVTERTREIGVRKALGARRRHILVQFLLEALSITFLGGVIGVVMSYVLVWAIGTRPFLASLLDDPTRQTDINLVLSSGILLTSTGILAFAGILSGLWPAFRASRLDPIEALRYE